MIAEIDQVWQAIREDDDIHVVVMRADGRAFCIGRDAEEIASTPPAELNPLGKAPLEALSPKTQQVWKPVIVAVNGLCGASAFYWLNQADIVIASEDTVFYDSHINIGTSALNEGSLFLAEFPLLKRCDLHCSASTNECQPKGPTKSASSARSYREANFGDELLKSRRSSPKSPQSRCKRRYEGSGSR